MGGFNLDISNVLALVRALDFKKLQFHGKDLRDILSEVEGEIIKTTLRDTDGNISAAARFLGLERTTLRMKIKKLGLEDGK